MCVNPNFIINHPVVKSPLINAIELKKSGVQRQLFANQLKDRQFGDDEAMIFDENYCKAL
ncbi:hypothetical protein IGI04_018895 [Brassica rapa subsp. trilocularis]|uniref:Uncharacterized protein n=1 Tax=Brassica rapa subsp. trilocularis TaxID=1813537 RepID=A0ABQ7ME98_BRACM|nr:hypothetical protein IGI04_018895 [Brassica rapa subsp. trilocularis]